MPMLKLSDQTMRDIRKRTPVGYRFYPAATQPDLGWWQLPVDDEVASAIARERVRGESDDGVVSRLLRDATLQMTDAVRPVQLPLDLADRVSM